MQVRAMQGKCVGWRENDGARQPRNHRRHSVFPGQSTFVGVCSEPCGGGCLPIGSGAVCRAWRAALTDMPLMSDMRSGAAW